MYTYVDLFMDRFVSKPLQVSLIQSRIRSTFISIFLLIFMLKSLVILDSYIYVNVHIEVYGKYVNMFWIIHVCVCM